jgi:hypothetical protein
MENRSGLAVRPWTVLGAAVVVGGAVVASSTRPFTTAADVVTAVPIAVAGGATVWWIGRGRRARTATAAARPPWTRRWVVWPVLAGVVAAWEIACFVSLPREAHPTLSVLIDALDSTRVGKTAAFVAWLALGWWLVTR